MRKWKDNLLCKWAAIGLAVSCVVGNFGVIPVHAETNASEWDDVIVSVSERQQGGEVAYSDAQPGWMEPGMEVERRFSKPQHEKVSVPVSVEDCEGEWNLAVVGSLENTQGYDIVDPAGIAPENRVKVAIIDSGVDETGDIDVFMRKNFIPGEEEASILFEDISCHGTSVAGVIAALDNDEGITGINPGIILYSARVLDAENRAPVSRVVEAIDWAISQDVDIINLSFGTTVDSDALRAAIKRAYAADILLVAAAGNQGVVEYPAAYEEVIAVGAVDASGNHSQGSAVGSELELVAPGEQIVSTSAFGGLCVAGGTSLAAPHVTGIASVLWQQDKSMPADFIRALLAFTANQYGNTLEYGYGLVDLDFALSQYNSFKEVYLAGGALDEQVAEAVEAGMLEYNEKPVAEFTDVEFVEGLWEWNDKVVGGHQDLLKDPNKDPANGSTDLVGIDGVGMSLSGMKVLKSAAIAPDRYFKTMQINPEYHGYTAKMESVTSNVKEYYSNYIFAYLFITKIASRVYREELPASVKVPTNIKCISDCELGVDCIDLMVTNIKSKFDKSGNLINEESKEVKNEVLDWSTLLFGEVTKQRKAIYIYGLALHSITDLFAHSSYRLDGTHIGHPDADDKNVYKNRYDCARQMCRYVIPHIKKFEPGSIEDIYNVLSTTYDKSFKLRRMKKYLEAADSQYYKDHLSQYQDILDAVNRN